MNCSLYAGSWLHCGYHLTTSIVAPVLLTLPFSFTLLGWVGGVLWLTLAAVITFYSYNLLSVVLEYHAQLGRRQLRFRDMARDILGDFSDSFASCFELKASHFSQNYLVFLGGHKIIMLCIFVVQICFHLQFKICSGCLET